MAWSYLCPKVIPESYCVSRERHHMESVSPWPGGIFQGPASSPWACCLLQEVPLTPTPFSVSSAPCGCQGSSVPALGRQSRTVVIPYQQGLEKDLKPDSDPRKTYVPEKPHLHSLSLTSWAVNGDNLCWYSRLQGELLGHRLCPGSSDCPPHFLLLPTATSPAMPYTPQPPLQLPVPIWLTAHS